MVAQTKEHDPIPISSALLTTTNTKANVFTTSTHVLNSVWIIDSGATDHMTFDVRQVTNLNPSSQNCVSTANGSTTPVVGKGASRLTNTLHFDSVLVVPFLNYNLLSVSQITTTLSCVVIFWPDHCMFKNIQTRQTIGYGVKRGKLYYLDLESETSSKLQ